MLQTCTALMYLYDISSLMHFIAVMYCTVCHPLSFISDSPREDPSHWDCKGCPSRILLFLQTSCSKTLLFSPSSVILAGVCSHLAVYLTVAVCVSAPFSEPASCLVFRQSSSLRAGLCNCPVYEPWSARWVDVLGCVKLFPRSGTTLEMRDPQSWPHPDSPSGLALPQLHP